MQSKADRQDKKAQLVHRRKEQILAAAKHIFARNGFRRTKIDQIAAAINVGKGTIYRYFKDKKSLFLAVFEQTIAQFRQAIKANVEPIADPQRKIAAAVRTYFEFFENDRELIEIHVQAMSEFKDDYRRVYLTLYSDYLLKIQENLRAGVKIGVFRELDVEKTAEAISASLQGVLQSFFYVREFGPETVGTDTEKAVPPELDYAKNSEAVQCPGRRRESLTDRTEAVTTLLLEGLLKRNNE